MLETTEAIVLNSRKYSETSKIVTVFSRKSGKINLIVKGAAKAKSKFGASLEPLNYISITYYKKPTGQLQLLSDAEIIVNFWNIRSSLEQLTFAFTIIETINKILEEYYVNENIFINAVSSLVAINDGLKSSFIAFLKFLIIFVANLGFEINFVLDNQEILDLKKQDFIINLDLENGQFYLTNNIFKNSDELQVPTTLFKKIKDVSKKNFNEINEIEFSKSEIYKTINLLRKYIHYHTDKNLFLDSLKFIN